MSSSFSMEDLGFDGFEDPGPVKLSKEGEAREEIMATLSKMRRDDIVTVSNTKWKVFNANGVSVYVTKLGTKGKKFYKLEVMSFLPKKIGVFQVLEGGDKLASEPEATDTW